MKKAIVMFAICTLCSASCGRNSESITGDNAQAKTAVTDSVTGFIQKMFCMVYQGSSSYGITTEEGKDYIFSVDYLGDNDELRLFINKEAQDILDPKKTGANRINTAYLGKKAKITFDKTSNKISALDILPDESRPPVSQLIYKATIKELANDRYGYKYLKFKTDKNEEMELRMDLDKDNHYTVSTIYNGQNKKYDCVFKTENYSLALIPGNEQKIATVQTGYKLIETKDVDPKDRTTCVRYYYGYVVRDVTWGEGNFQIPTEQQD